MAYTLSPSILPATLEATDVNQTVSVLVSGLDPVVSSIVVTKGANTSGNIVVNVTGSSFTLTGQYYDNWTKSITYEEFTPTGNITAIATTWDAISANLNFVTSYVAETSPSSKTASYSVLVNGSTTLTLTQVINNNFTPGALNLIKYVSKGKY